jgi:regulator of protease activity HflC (stomatin/prohibitin superfamily)
MTMLAFTYLLLLTGILLFIIGAGVLAFDAWRLYRKFFASGEGEPFSPGEIRWRLAVILLGTGILPLLAGLSVTVVPTGMAGLRISQFSGTIPGTLFPGTHFSVPLVQSIELYDVREKTLSTAAADGKSRSEVLSVQTREGLVLGVAATVRYRYDPRRLDYIHDNLPAGVDQEIVVPVVTSAFREVLPNYTVREVFSVRRDEVRKRASDLITAKLAADGILVKEVMIRDLVLPSEYAKGLEGLLLKEQENERMGMDLEVKQKLVRAAELEAEALKAREIKQAEAAAQVTVLQAKAQADAMQHTLPLKEKQIQQSRLEAEARKEATLKNAEAAAQAKIIDSHAELEKRNLMAEAEDHRIRLIAGADAERMRAEAAVLKQNPLLIQKIVAERLSDKVQIMMVPMDGKFFFTNDVLRNNPMSIAMPRTAEDSDK